MKKLLTLILMLLPMVAVAQELANFILMPDGTYQTEDGKDFVIIPFEGKTAHQIYQELASNVGSTYNDPSKVMSGVEDASIKIRAFSDFLWVNKVLGITHNWGGYYQLEFRIKDGRVRVAAPVVEDIAMDTQPHEKWWYKSKLKKWFKDGVVKEGDKQKYDEIVAHMNGIINRILYTSSVQDASEDW
ncbi:MAG: hypothetical protein HDR86_00815 [Bacteroides sp.]|nr:hypothetical protein [Bacteroides sp.]